MIITNNLNLSHRIRYNQVRQYSEKYFLIQLLFYLVIISKNLSFHRKANKTNKLK